MNTQLLSQVVLPITLALIMLGMGLSLKPADFGRILQQPKAALVGILGQLLILPLLAWTIIVILRPAPEVAAGLILLALCPGGATSNLIAHLSRGDTALSITLTAVVSLIAPFTLPFLVNLNFGWLGLQAEGFHLPFWQAVMKLSAVTLVPVVLGMAFRHFFDQLGQKLERPVNVLSAMALFVIVLLLIKVNWTQLPGFWSLVTAACLMLCVSGMGMGYLLARTSRLSPAQGRTMAVEVGIQNAGTAMLVAMTMLQNPALALTPLAYGILMNLPAFLLIGWINLLPATRTAKAAA